MITTIQNILSVHLKYCEGYYKIHQHSNQMHSFLFGLFQKSKIPLFIYRKINKLEVKSLYGLCKNKTF